MIDYHSKYAWAVSLPNKCGTKKHKFLKLLLAYWERRKINKCGPIVEKSSLTKHIWNFLNKTKYKFIQQFQSYRLYLLIASLEQYYIIS